MQPSGLVSRSRSFPAALFPAALFPAALFPVVLVGLLLCAPLAAGARVSSETNGAPRPPSDPQGDLFESGPDIVALSLDHQNAGDAPRLDLRLRLAAAPADPSALFGFIDLDTDGDPATGGQSSVDFLTRGTSRPRTPHEQGAFGSELRLELAGWTPSDPSLDLVDEATGFTVSRVPATWSGPELTLSLPDTLRAGLGTPPVRATAVIGTDEVMSDVAPNQGHVASEAPEGTELRDGRFVISVSWRDFQDNEGEGTVVTQSEDSALYWFFQPSNWELLVKVLDGCALNQHQWVFVAATTNVEFTLRVFDRDTGLERTYFNPLGTAAPAINDTEAFASCAP